MIYLFRTEACAIGGACKRWLPYLRERYVATLIEIVEMQPEREHLEIFCEAMARCSVIDGNPNNMPWIYDSGTGRIGLPRQNSEPGVEWQ